MGLVLTNVQHVLLAIIVFYALSFHNTVLLVHTVLVVLATARIVRQDTSAKLGLLKCLLVAQVPLVAVGNGNVLHVRLVIIVLHKLHFQFRAQKVNSA